MKQYFSYERNAEKGKMFRKKMFKAIFSEWLNGGLGIHKTPIDVPFEFGSPSEIRSHDADGVVMPPWVLTHTTTYATVASEKLAKVLLRVPMVFVFLDSFFSVLIFCISQQFLFCADFRSGSVCTIQFSYV